MTFFEYTRSFPALTTRLVTRVASPARFADVSDTFCWSLTVQHPELTARHSTEGRGQTGDTTPKRSCRSTDRGIALATIAVAVVGAALAALLAGGPPAPEAPTPLSPEVTRAAAERCAAAPALCAPRAA